MSEKNNSVRDWISERGVNFVLKGKYKHLDHKPALRDSLGKKIKIKGKRESENFLESIYIQLNKDKIKLIDFLNNFLQPENISRRKFLPFLLGKRPKFKIAWVAKKNASDKGRKKNIKREYRPIMWASHFDSIIYRYLCYIWGREYEIFVTKNNLDQNVIAYRSIYDEDLKMGKNNINFAVSSFDFIRDRKNVLAGVFDISKFFENLDHIILKKNLLTVLNKERLENSEYTVYKRLTSYSLLDQDEIRKNIQSKKKIICSVEDMKLLIKDKKIKIFSNKSGKGIPQGSPLSGLLANIYMIDFDKEIKELCENNNMHYSRYSDDIILIGDQDDVTRIGKILIDKITALTKLEIKQNKTKYAFFKDGKCTKTISYRNEKIVTNVKNPKLEYLGCEFDGINIGIKSGSLSRFYQKLSRKIRKYRFAKRGKKIVVRQVSYPTSSKKRNFGGYIKSALTRIKNNTFVQKQFARHIPFIKNGFKLPKKKKK